MEVSKLLLVFALTMFTGFSFSYDIYIDGSPIGENFEISAGTHSAKLELISENLTILNYSFHINPKNIENFLIKMNISLTDTLNAVMPSQSVSHSGTIEIPEIICGTYSILGETYYIENGTMGQEIISKSIQIPCETGRAKLLYFAISYLPWGIVNFFAGRFLGI